MNSYTDKDFCYLSRVYRKSGTCEGHPIIICFREVYLQGKWVCKSVSNLRVQAGLKLFISVIDNQNYNLLFRQGCNNCQGFWNTIPVYQFVVLLVPLNRTNISQDLFFL